MIHGIVVRRCIIGIRFKRQNELLNSLENVQTIITCTGLDEFIENRFKINKIFKVKRRKSFEKLFN